MKLATWTGLALVVAFAAGLVWAVWLLAALAVGGVLVWSHVTDLATRAPQGWERDR